jgi:hypothetical protein
MNVQRTEMVTSCRRRVITGRFRIPATPGIERVVLRIDPDGEHTETVWASLTADEAVALAHTLLREANAIAS